MHVRRALLYMPGDDMRKIQKATTLGVDCICMDMEDGVALNRKAEARQTIVEALKTLDFGKSERLARINAIGSGFEKEDLAAVLPALPNGIVVPKVESAEQLHFVSEMIGKYEQRYDLTIDGIVLLAIVESARGIVNLGSIASSETRLQAIIFGAEDFASDVGAVRTRLGTEVLYARSAVVAYTAANDLQAIDMVYIDFKDTEGLRQEALEGFHLGFSGKQIIHPNQVAPVQQAYTPSDEAIAYAERLVQAFEENQQAGRGAFALDGKMIDAPLMKAARRVLGLAQAAGKTNPRRLQ